MRFLFIHQNFPGQFRHVAPELVRRGHEVVAMRLTQATSTLWNGVKVVTYWPKRSSTPGIHPWVVDLETKVVRAEAAYAAMQALAERGFVPDAVIAHPGWGESLFVKRVWPGTKLGIYCEFFYKVQGADWHFEPEFESGGPAEDCRIDLKNANTLLQLETADAGLSPTAWQASTFPERFRSQITVCHDGIDTTLVKPDLAATYTLPSGQRLSHRDEIVTFVNRNLEPYRGYHRFMRALPRVMRDRPEAQILIVGGDEVSYGRKAPDGNSWKKIFLDEVRGRIDLSRVHFLGRIPYPDFLSLLRVSTVHAYLTYPFVLSWSLLEAMSTGCAIVASDTPPVREVITDGETGQLVDFFDSDGLAETICRTLAAPASERAAMGARARKLVVDEYDLATSCLPRQAAWVLGLARSPAEARSHAQAETVPTEVYTPRSDRAAVTISEVCPPLTRGTPDTQTKRPRATKTTGRKSATRKKEQSATPKARPAS